MLAEPVHDAHYMSARNRTELETQNGPPAYPNSGAMISSLNNVCIPLAWASPPVHECIVDGPSQFIDRKPALRE